MTLYKFTGDQTQVFPSLQTDTGSTLVLNVGDTVDLAADPGSPLLEPVDTDAEATVTATAVEPSPVVEAPAGDTPTPIEAHEAPDVEEQA